HGLLLADSLAGIRLECWLSLHEGHLVLLTVMHGRALPPPASATVIETEVDENAIEPRREARLAPEPVSRLIDPQECFLGHIARILCIAEHRPGQPIRARLIPLDQLVEGALLPRRHPRAER